MHLPCQVFFGTCRKELVQDLLHNGFAEPKPSLYCLSGGPYHCLLFFFFFFPVQRGSQDWNQLLFLELLLKKQQQFFSVQRCFCEKEFLLGARCGVGL